MLWSELKPSQREPVRQLARELLEDVRRPDSDVEDIQDKIEKRGEVVKGLVTKSENPAGVRPLSVRIVRLCSDWQLQERSHLHGG